VIGLFWPALAAAAGIHVATLHGSINPGSAEYVLESLKAAQSGDAFVLEIDTPGGLISSSRLIIEGIAQSKVPVVVWVTPNGAAATSAGALIALSATKIAMHSGTNLGAAHPVNGNGDDIKGDMRLKIVNDTAALARAQATLHGRDEHAAEEIVTKSRSFSPEEAIAAHVADFVADDLASVLKKAGLPAAAEIRHPMSLRQSFVNFLSDPNVSAVLISLGGLAVWAEVSSGFSSIAAGVVGVLAFVLGFVSLQTLPVTLGGEILLVMGFALLAVEGFVTSHGALSAGAVISILLGGLFLIDPSSGSMHVSLLVLLPLVAALALVLGTMGYAIARDRKHLGIANPLLGAEATVSVGGKNGKAYVNGELWNFESVEELSNGERTVVERTEGLKIYLKRRT
jgi:membrane-bound serine protease (ClpP class)